MWNFLQPINLLRYLIVLRVNRSRVTLPQHLAGELSLVLGHIITERLPTTEARLWRKALQPWQETGALDEVGTKKQHAPPEIAWPVQTVFFVYPTKREYGTGELITFELKLLGEGAEHAFFLEVILPALEQAGFETRPAWRRKTVLWGNFDIHAVYSSHGGRWKPIVTEGKLNLRVRVTPRQWAYRLKFTPTYKRGKPAPVYRTLTWLTPFDFSDFIPVPPKKRSPRSEKRTSAPADQIPSLTTLLDALTQRISQLLPGKYNTPEDVWGSLNVEEQTDFLDALEQASHIHIVHPTRILPASPPYPPRWIGKQTFQPIPLSVIPYLELASILHIGKYTHFGNGTFKLS